MFRLFLWKWNIRNRSNFSSSFSCNFYRKKKIVYEIKKKLIELNIKNFKIIHKHAITWLKKARKSYDIIFLDPPFNTTLLQDSIIQLEKNRYTKNHSLIYIERENTSKKIFIPKNWKLYKEKKTKKVNYQLHICKKYD
ncbi:MAG: RsmD family RNA methyltransferase [Buchnera aphidicola (Nurudea shiraii)]